MVALERGDHGHGLEVVAAGGLDPVAKAMRSEVCSVFTSGSGSPSTKMRLPAAVIGVGFTHSPIPESWKSRQGNFSPGSFLRDGAMSECATTRSAGMRWRVKMLRQSAITAAVWRRGKSG